MMLVYTVCMTIWAIGLRSGEASQLNSEVYVSKYRGDSNNRNCGSKHFPCRSLQLGFDVLAPGGHLYVYGGGTKFDPYNCQSSDQKFIVKKSFIMTSYLKRATISCTGGIAIQSEGKVRMTVNITGITFHKTPLDLENTDAVFNDCKFMQATKAISVKISRDLNALDLSIDNSLFTKNIGCIHVNVEVTGELNTMSMAIQNTLFDTNKGRGSNELVSFDHKRCINRRVLLKSVWKNVTLLKNSYKRKRFYEDACSNDSFCSKCGYNDSSKCNAEHDPSFFVVNAYSATLHFENIQSRNNVNVRFLKVRSCESYLKIYQSLFVSHNIRGSGGVIYIPEGRNVDVLLKDSTFYKNEADIGGVLQIEKGLNRSVTLKAINCSFKYSDESHSGIKTGCVLSVGNVSSSRGVREVSAIIHKNTFERCSKICKKGAFRSRYGPLCLATTHNGNVIIENSKFVRSKNNKGSAVFIVHSGEMQGGSLHVKVLKSEFLCNVGPMLKLSALGVFINDVCNVSESSLFISDTVFERNVGVAVKTANIQNISFTNVSCIKTNGTCYEYFIGREQHSTCTVYNASLLIKNSLFAENFQCLHFKLVQPIISSVEIRNTKILENTLTNSFVVSFGLNTRKELDLTAVFLMENVIFKSNQMTKTKKESGFIFGFIVPITHNGSVSVIFRHCVFDGNSQALRNNKKQIPTMIFLRCQDDPVIHPKHLTGKRKKPEFPSYKYLNSFLFENVTFENNMALTYLMYVLNANTTFRNCLFKNNFSYRPKIGAHLFIEKGTGTVTIQDSIFLQNEIRSSLRSNPMQSVDYLLMAFVFAGGTGPLLLRNSSFIADISERIIPHFTIQTEGFVYIDNNTKLICPVGSYMNLENGSHIIYLNVGQGSINITQMKFSCKTCGSGKYSIERGLMHGTRLQNIQCFNFCPYGSICTNNIQSRHNFWGYLTFKTPPQLNFTRCPEQYCRSPKTKYNTSIYNKCIGNRTGVMCGMCKKGFTESIFNHKCRPSNECTDKWFWLIAFLYSFAISFYIIKRPPVVWFLVDQMFWFRRKKECVTESDTVQQHHGGHGFSKVIFYFYQIADLLMLDSTTDILKRNILLSSVIAFYNFEVEAADSSFGCPFSGLNVVTKALFRSSKVFVSMGFLLVFYAFHYLSCFFLKRSRPSFAPYIAAIVEVLLLGYERLGHTSLELLHCTPLKIDGHTEWRLFLDGNITCWVHWWQFALVAYNIIFVLPFLVVLLVGTSKLRRHEISPMLFVLACFVPLPFLIVWIVRCKTYNARDNEEHDEMRQALLDVLQGPFRQPDSQSKGTLYWESILIGRRLILLCISAFVTTPMIRLLFMTVLCSIALFHNTISNPYKDKKANSFALLIHWMLVALATVNLCKSVLVTIGVFPEDPVKTQIFAMQIFEVVIIGLLPGLLGLLIAAVLVSQVPRLVVIVVRCARDVCLCRKDLSTSSRQLLTIAANEGFDSGFEHDVIIETY